MTYGMPAEERIPNGDHILVLDLESGLSSQSIALLPGDDEAVIERAGLQGISAACTLAFFITDAGLVDIALEALVDDEEAMLRHVDASLRALGATGRLVTHNGVAHDLPLCLRRCMALWLFDCHAIAEWNLLGRDRHLDTMLRLGGGRRPGPSLTDLCASLGIPAATPTVRGRRSVDPRVRKGSVDVVQTALIFLHLEAMRRGDPRWLAACWRDLARYLLQPGVRGDHLMPMVRQGLAVADAVQRREPSSKDRP